MRLKKLLTRLIDGTSAPRPTRSADEALIDLVCSQQDLPFFLHPPVSRR